MQWHVKIPRLYFIIKSLIIVIGLFFCINGDTNHLIPDTLEVLAKVTSLNNNKNINKVNHINENKAIVPYSFFSNMNYTAKFDTFRFGNYQIKIDKIENINKMSVIITKNNSNPSSPSSPNNLTSNELKIDQPLPWWSKLAPTELQQIDFSEVDGASDFYNLGNGYQLVLLQKQGAWGKVYLLEHIAFDKKCKICAVKVIFTRSNRSYSIEEFQKRHITEIKNNLIISKVDLAVKPFGIIRNDDNHYLLFMEYGESAHDYFKKLSSEELVKKIACFINEVEKMHASGFAHGDLKIDNMLVINNKIKLCDWLSLNEYNKTIVGKYRYIGDNLPPEAIRANYFKKDHTLRYSVVGSNASIKAHLLHPVLADRFCMGVSLLEVLEPDLYKKITYTPKDFNPWSPKSLDFYSQYVSLIKETQAILLEKANKFKDLKRKILYKQLSQYMDVDPMKRVIQFNPN